MSDVKETVLKFIDCINRQDVDGMAALMSEDHVFCDPEGGRCQGRQSMRQAWGGYFRMTADYHITVDRTVEQGDSVAVFGMARGIQIIDGKASDKNRWETPGAWLGVVKDSRVKEWRVYADLEKVYRIIERSRQATGSNRDVT